MPRIQKISLIKLTAFRQRNGILQKELADYLGVSRGYVSMVESGKSTLSKENIDKIFQNPYHWNIDILIPAYSRLKAAINYLNITKNEQRTAEGLNPTYITFESNEKEIEENIKYGYNDIPYFLAEKLCMAAPELNKNWLLSGNGEMVNKEDEKRPSQIEILQNKIDNLTDEIKELKSILKTFIKTETPEPLGLETSTPAEVKLAVAKDWRDRNLTYIDVAKRTGYGYPTICNIMANKTAYFTPKQAQKFKMQFNYNLEFLILGNGNLLSESETN